MLEVYNYQVISLCIRILNEAKLLNKNTGYIAEEVGKTLFFVITKQINNRNRELLISFIMDKAKGEVLTEIIYTLLHDITRENVEILSPNAYNKIKDHFKGLLQNTETKASVKGIYYICKTIALIEIEALNQAPPAKQVITYEDLILELEKAYYKKEAVPKMDKIELLVKQSPREKVYYILKCLQ